MKKDRLDNLLVDAFSDDSDERNLSAAGLERFRSGIASASGAGTVLDSILKAAFVADVDMPQGVIDSGLRRLRNRLTDIRKPSWSPYMRPVLALASVAVLVIIAVMVQSAHSPSGAGIPVDNSTKGPFSEAFKSRSDIMASISDLLTVQLEPEVSVAPIEEKISPLETRRIGVLNSFSSKARGESFARTIDNNRREILASLTIDKDGSNLGNGDESKEEGPATAPTQHQIFLRQRLSRAKGNS